MLHSDYKYLQLKGEIEVVVTDLEKNTLFLDDNVHIVVLNEYEFQSVKKKKKNEFIIEKKKKSPLRKHKNKRKRKRKKHLLFGQEIWKKKHGREREEEEKRKR